MRESSLKVAQGDFVVLPCSFFTSSPLSRLNIIWTMAPSLSPENPIQVRTGRNMPPPNIHRGCVCVCMCV